MNVDPFFVWLEATTLRTWTRESDSSDAGAGQRLSRKTALLAITSVVRPVMALEAGQVAPLPARIIGGVSLPIWVSVLIAGRMEAFFKPLPNVAQ